MPKQVFLSICIATLLCSCSNKPSEKEIANKILLEYVCMETAKVNDLKIIKTEETQTILGNPAYRYTVTGEVQWPQGCKEFGTGIQPGAIEKFEKTVTLGKNDNGDWQ